LDIGAHGVQKNHHLETDAAEKTKRARAQTADRAGGKLAVTSVPSGNRDGVTSRLSSKIGSSGVSGLSKIAVTAKEPLAQSRPVGQSPVQPNPWRAVAARGESLPRLLRPSSGPLRARPRPCRRALLGFDPATLRRIAAVYRSPLLCKADRPINIERR
jgi:hypothetical protein